MPRLISMTIVMITLLSGIGCALTAKQPPTPAEHIRAEDLAAIPVPEGERYYLLLFASQSTPKRPKYTHTWATVVRAHHPGGCEPPRILETHTISWLPADGNIKTFQFRVEPGVNFTLEQSLDHVTRNDERIALWGPYEVWHGFYHRFLVQKGFLESGETGYQCIDTLGEAAKGLGCNCTHAITDMDPRYERGPYPPLLFGFDSGRNIIREIMHAPVIIEPKVRHDWLLSALGVDHWDVSQRRYIGRRTEYDPGEYGLNGPRSPSPLPIPDRIRSEPPAESTPTPQTPESNLPKSPSEANPKSVPMSQ